MEVRLSGLEEYRQFARALAEMRLADAVAALDRCLRRPDIEASPQTRAFLLQARGDVLCDMGDEQAAIASHEAGVSADPASPLPALRLAKFLALRLQRHRDALAHCEEARRKQSAVQAREGGAARWERLTALILALEARCHAALGERVQARRKIDDLASAEQFVAEHTIEACELLLRDRESEATARSYLEGLLRWLEATGEDLVDLRARIAQMLAIS